MDLGYYLQKMKVLLTFLTSYRVQNLRNLKTQMKKKHKDGEIIKLLTKGGQRKGETEKYILLKRKKETGKGRERGEFVTSELHLCRFTLKLAIQEGLPSKKQASFLTLLTPTVAHSS